MDNLKEKMIEKAEKEQVFYRKWLLAQKPEEILEHTYEYTMREDILLKLNDMELDNSQIKALLKAQDIISSIYQRFTKFETEYMEQVEESVRQEARRRSFEDEIE